ncbi:MAG: hypothetical protein L3J41_03540 [Melioribacteraceae bacterium]|nr:hypothetical protein [Melioribacteraceae bacterium]
MASLLDVLGATVIAGFIILMIIQLNARMVTSSMDMLSGTITQSDAALSASIIEHYMYKIGHRATSNKISIADSNMIKFCGDIDNDSSVDTVTFYLDEENDFTDTDNPNDKGLYRIENNGAAVITSIVSKFELSYFDSIGTQLDFGSLGSQTVRDKIRSIKIFIEFEAAFSIDDFYQGVTWKRVIRPKNISAI